MKDVSYLKFRVTALGNLEGRAAASSCIATVHFILGIPTWIIRKFVTVKSPFLTQLVFCKKTSNDRLWVLGWQYPLKSRVFRQICKSSFGCVWLLETVIHIPDESQPSHDNGLFWLLVPEQRVNSQASSSRDTCSLLWKTIVQIHLRVPSRLLEHRNQTNICADKEF